MRDWLKKHRLEAGLFTLGIAALFTGITLIAQPGNGFWGTVGWALTIGGVLCLAGAALLWEPFAEMFGNGPAAPTPAPPPAPHDPEAPAEEKRTFVPSNVTPEYLVDLFEDRTDMQAQTLVDPYIGKWMTVSGLLGNVGIKNDYFTQVTFKRMKGIFDEGSRFELHGEIYMYFRKPGSEDLLAMLRPGTEIAVLGRLKEVNRIDVHLDDCELV